MSIYLLVKIFIIKFLLFVIFQQISSQPSPFGFKNQFIGSTRYIKPEQEQNRTFCNNYWCTNDAHYLFTKSSQYPNVDPCVDFKNFSVNQIEEVDVPDDRLYFRGFTSITLAKYDERLRKVVAAKFDPVKDENSRVIKIVKNTFRQCLKSKHVLRHIQAHKDIVEHLQSLGGSPYLSKHIHFNPKKFNEATDYGIDDIWINNVPNSFNEDELWTGQNFNVRKYFEIEPKHALSLFFDLEIKRCENDVVCLKKPQDYWDLGLNEELEFESYKEMFRTLDDAFVMRPQLRKILVKELYKPAVKRFREFMTKRSEVNEKFVDLTFTSVKIKDLQNINVEKVKIDWLKVLNSELFENSKLTENNEILIEGNLEMLQELVKNLQNIDKKTISDTFTISFLYWNRFQIILRFHNDQAMSEKGTKHGAQRWDTCLLTFYDYLQPALLVMYEQRRAIWDRTLGDFDRNLEDERIDIVGSAEKLIQEAVDEFKKKFFEQNMGKLPIKVSAEILFKLKNLKILIGLPNSIFPISKLDEFYENLNLIGNENFMKSYWEIEKHHRKIFNEPRTSWRRQINRIVDTENIYAGYRIDDGNILYFSPFYTIYPFYHPMRPRFFNMATLFSDVIIRLYQDVRKYIMNKYKIDVGREIEQSISISYEHYKNWLRTHKDLQIGANYLTNEQLFWVSYAVNYFKKFHRTVPKTIDKNNRLVNEYLHVNSKIKKGFRDAFKCELTEDEKRKYEEYLEKYKINQQMN